MILLDTDIVTLIQRGDSEPALRIRGRIAQLPAGELVATTIITYHEQTRGWLGYIAKARTNALQVYAYSLLAAHVDNYREARVMPYDQKAADTYDQLRRDYPRLGAMDLRIAAIAQSRGAVLVSRNLNDFRQVVGLQVEDWTKP